MNLQNLVLVVLLFMAAQAATASAPIPIETKEPLLEFALTLKSEHPEEYKDCLIMKVEADFDGNGNKDYMLSTRCQVLGDYYPIGAWGNAGGNWAVYLNVNDKFILYPVAFFHPAAFSYQRVGKEGVYRLLSYHRHNAEGGSQGIEEFNAPYSEELELEANHTLVFSEEVSRDNDYQVSGKNAHLYTGELYADAFECKLDSFFSGQCNWKESYCKTEINGQCQ